MVVANERSTWRWCALVEQAFIFEITPEAHRHMREDGGAVLFDFVRCDGAKYE